MKPHARAELDRTKFQPLELSAPTSSSLWKTIGCALLLAAATTANAQEAVSPIELLRQSREQVSSNNLDYALGLAKAAVEADPAFVDGWKQQGRVEMLRGKPAAAIAAFDTVNRLRPGDPDIPVWTIWIMLDAGYVRDAATRIEQRTDAELLKTGDPLVARALTALLHRDFPDDAAKLAARWQKISTNEPSRAAAAVFAQLARGETTSAVAALEKLAPEKTARDLLANAWLRIGRVRAKSGDTAGAKSAFTKALEIWPGWSAAEKELTPPAAK